MASYKNIYYDKSVNQMYVWGLDDNGKSVNKKVRPIVDYYVPDETGTSDIRDIYGNPVKKQTTNSYANLKQILTSGIGKTCEAGIAQDIKFLHSHYNADEIIVDINNYNICTIDIEVEVGDKPKPFTQMVEDCESVINLITIHSSKNGKVWTWGNKPYNGSYGEDNLNWEYFYCPNEKQLLQHFIATFKQQKFDIITGWNSKYFDLRYLIDRCDKLNVGMSLSPINKYEVSKDKDDFGNTVKWYKIAGISQLDGKALYENFTYTKEVSYSLNYIGMRVCNEGKLDLDDSINKVYETNWDLFVEYNIQDVMLVTKIEAKKKFIELAVTLCSQALIPFEGVFSSIKVITGYFLTYLHRYGLVMPDIPKTDKEKYPGAFVKANRGVYRYLISFDFASLYPTIIRMFNISPETLILDPDEDLIPSLIKTPASVHYECDTPSGKFSVGGIYYNKEKEGILPKIVTAIYFERVEFKNKAKMAFNIAQGYTIEQITHNQHWSIEKTTKLYNEVLAEGYSEDYYNSQQLIRKILINSMYGVLGNAHFMLYNIKNAMAITIAARDVINYMSDNINKYFKTTWHKTFWKHFPEYSHMKGKVPPIDTDMVPVIDTDSVDGDTMINSSVGRIKISELFDMCKDIEVRGENNFIGKLPNDILSESLNIDTKCIENNKINYVMKHKVKKEMFKITVNGKEIICTEDHSVMVKRNNEIISISPKDIISSDILIHKTDNKVIFESMINCNIESLGIVEQDVYDIEVENNHNFFGNDILVHNSNYVCCDEIIKGLGLTFETDEEFRIWGDDFNVRFMTPFFEKLLDLYAKKYNTNNLHEFKIEKIVSSKMVLKKKKYADVVLSNEGKVYPKPKLAVTGIDMVKTTTPSLFKSASTDILEDMLINKDPKRIIAKLKEYKKQFMNAPIEDIACPRSVNNYDKYGLDLFDMEDGAYVEDIHIKSGTPQHVKAAILYNAFITKHNIVLPYISNGSKIRVVYVSPNNILKSDVVAFVGKFPEEFHKYFQIDYETQWYKFFIKLINEFYDAHGWGEVMLETTNLMKYFKK